METKNEANQAPAAPRKPGAVKATIDFDTRSWEIENGKQPRGFGSWAFALERNPDVCAPGVVFWTSAMTYGDAKKAARAHYLAQAQAAGFSGYVVVYVLT